MTVREVFEKVRNFHTIKAYRNYKILEDYVYYSKLRSEYLGEFRLCKDALKNDNEVIDLNSKIDAYTVEDGVLTIFEQGAPIYVP